MVFGIVMDTDCCKFLIHEVPLVLYQITAIQYYKNNRFMLNYSQKKLHNKRNCVYFYGLLQHFHIKPIQILE